MGKRKRLHRHTGRPWWYWVQEWKVKEKNTEEDMLVGRCKQRPSGRKMSHEEGRGGRACRKRRLVTAPPPTQVCIVCLMDAGRTCHRRRREGERQ